MDGEIDKGALTSARSERVPESLARQVPRPAIDVDGCV